MSDVLMTDAKEGKDERAPASPIRLDGESTATASAMATVASTTLKTSDKKTDIMGQKKRELMLAKYQTDPAALPDDDEIVRIVSGDKRVELSLTRRQARASKYLATIINDCPKEDGKVPKVELPPVVRAPPTSVDGPTLAAVVWYLREANGSDYKKISTPLASKLLDDLVVQKWRRDFAKCFPASCKPVDLSPLVVETEAKEAEAIKAKLNPTIKPVKEGKEEQVVKEQGGDQKTSEVTIAASVASEVTIAASIVKETNAILEKKLGDKHAELKALCQNTTSHTLLILAANYLEIPSLLDLMVNAFMAPFKDVEINAFVTQMSELSFTHMGVRPTTPQLKHVSTRLGSVPEEKKTGNDKTMDVGAAAAAAAAAAASACADNYSQKQQRVETKDREDDDNGDDGEKKKTGGGNDGDRGGKKKSVRSRADPRGSDSDGPPAPKKAKFPVSKADKDDNEEEMAMEQSMKKTRKPLKELLKKKVKKSKDSSDSSDDDENVKMAKKESLKSTRKKSSKDSDSDKDE